MPPLLCRPPTLPARRLPPRPVVRTARVTASASAAPSPSSAPPAPAISLTPAALAQCRALAAKRADEGELVLRVGVKSGGCNGMR